MKKIKKFLIILLATNIVVVSLTYATAVTISSNPPTNYIDGNLSAKINSTRTVLEMKNLVNSYMEFPTLTFGSYVQTALPLIKTPIEWLILEKRGNVAILMSKYVLDQQVFQNNTNPTYWYQSNIKIWLDNNFINSAFNNTEKNSIVKNNDNILGTAYLLNINEASYYFVDSQGRDFSGTTPTKHAELVPSSNEVEKFGYWLRPENTSNVVSGTKVLFRGIGDAVDCATNCTFGVRPVISVVFDPNIYTPQPYQPITPTPVPSPSPIPYTPQPEFDRSLCVEGRIYRRGTVRKTFTVRYYLDIINSIEKRISIKVKLSIPKVDSNNPLKAKAINNLINYNAYGLLKSFINDFVERKQIIKTPVVVKPMPFDKDQGETVEIPFEMVGYGQICRLVIDIPSNQCNLEEDK